MVHRSLLHSRRHIFIVYAALCVALFVATSACEPRGMDAQAAMGTTDSQRVSHFVDEVGEALTPYVASNIEQLRTAPTLEMHLSNASTRMAVTPEHLDALQQLYGERAYAPIFVENGTLTDAGVAVSEVMLHADIHGFDAADFHGPRIQEEIVELWRHNAPARIHGALELLPQDREDLMLWVSDQMEGDDRLPAKTSVLEQLVDDVDASPLPELSALIQSRIDAVEPLVESANTLEILLADSVLRWSIAQRFHNLRYITTDIANARGWRIIVDGEVYSTRQPGSPYSEPTPDPELLTDITGDEVALTLAKEHFRRAVKDGNFERALDEVAPPFKDYANLVRAAKKYRAIVLTGGWNTIADALDLSIGDQSAHVVALRKRLAVEGYFRGDMESDVFDSALRTAVLTYQETHQLRATGTLTDETLNSLNIPALERLAHIHVVQERWRQSRIGEDADDQYIVVNVPDFHVELWDNGERVHRMRAVVGATRHWRDKNGEMQVDGRTPLFSDLMQYLVFNPYWNVPTSLVRGYKKKIEENPNWLEEEGFEFIPTEEGGQLLRQLPSTQNALGLVKFLFPNAEDVYMHDTNNHRLFQHAFRNYSHGCVRVDDALGFAALLISRDQNISRRGGERYVQRKLEEGENQWVGLHTPIPVHIEYYSVRVDDDGYTNFLADFHRRDRSLVEKREAWLVEYLQNRPAESTQLAGLPALSSSNASGASQSR